MVSGLGGRRVLFQPVVLAIFSSSIGACLDGVASSERARFHVRKAGAIVGSVTGIVVIVIPAWPLLGAAAERLAGRAGAAVGFGEIAPRRQLVSRVALSVVAGGLLRGGGHFRRRLADDGSSARSGQGITIVGQVTGDAVLDVLRTFAAAGLGAGPAGRSRSRFAAAWWWCLRCSS